MQVIEINGDKIPSETLVAKIVSCGMMPQLVKEMTLDRCLADFSLTPDEEKTAWQNFYQQMGMDTDVKMEAWLRQQGMTRQDMGRMAERSLKLAKFKQATWEPKVNAAFLERKQQLDRVIYSLLCTKDYCTSQELFFRIKEGEQSFDQLAREYSQGLEAQTGGLTGPVELGAINPRLAEMLISSDIGQVQAPTAIGDWIVILRLEKILPAILDAKTQQRLIDEKFMQWLEKTVSEQMSTFAIAN